MSFVSPGVDGVVRAKDVLAAITPATVLVSVMAVNNELGSDNRAELVEIGRSLRKDKVLFHSDCV